ncbi:guanosine-3',5'-bis(diphosphate) 3'-pyrophosphohydrolase MESH1 isoform X1 [Heptranchias perlo]|uniref:guanosine-3',5'-bis(diphosphate) 3'-pyrophosphohydrolase MESH1 isoform X1 n=1 Tax=Heptranchias perlo TaxID=212740 RepID=UPI00355953D8
MSSDVQQILEAADFAAKKHKNQRRNDPEGTPYINHPLGVSRILSHEAAITDVVVLQAALLHDTVEDTDTTFAEIEEKFGEKVRSIVAEVTDDKSLLKEERKQRQIEHAPHCSREAKLVKLADKLYNLRDLKRCTPGGRRDGLKNISSGLPKSLVDLEEPIRSWKRAWMHCSKKETFLLDNRILFEKD